MSAHGDRRGRGGEQPGELRRREPAGPPCEPRQGDEGDDVEHFASGIGRIEARMQRVSDADWDDGQDDPHGGDGIAECVIDAREHHTDDVAHEERNAQHCCRVERFVQGGIRVPGIWRHWADRRGGDGRPGSVDADGRVLAVGERADAGAQGAVQAKAGFIRACTNSGFFQNAGSETSIFTKVDTTAPDLRVRARRGRRRAPRGRRAAASGTPRVRARPRPRARGSLRPDCALCRRAGSRRPD